MLPRPLSLAAALKGLAVLAAVAMLGYRFAHLDLVPFILDEPQFLRAAGAQLNGGQWVSASPVPGTQGYTYGPSPLWFYGAVQWLLGPAPLTSLVAMCLLVTLAHGALAVSVTRLFRGDALRFAALLGMVAASPYQFFWSRLAWDPFVNLSSAWAVALLCWPGPLGWPRRMALGLVLGLAVSSHLMSVPLVALVFAVLAWEERRKPTALAATVGSVGAVALGVNLPYLHYLLTTPQARPPAPGPVTWELLGEHLVQPVRVFTSWGLGYFFDADWPRFLAWCGDSARWLERAGWSVGLLGGLALVGLFSNLRPETPEQRRVVRLALLVWVGYAAFYTLRTLPRHPHYQFATWWLVVVGVAAALHALHRRSPRWGTVATVGVLVGAVAQFSVNVAWMGFVREQGGTRGVHYSTPLAAQQRLVQEACARAAGGTVLLRNETLLFPHSLDYVARTTPACEGVQVGFCPPWGCPTGAPVARVRYAGPTGGALRLE